MNTTILVVNVHAILVIILVAVHALLVKQVHVHPNSWYMSNNVFPDSIGTLPLIPPTYLLIAYRLLSLYRHN